MHPNAFLRRFWSLDFKPQVFVAMTFADRYRPRFDNVIHPAIAGIQIDGKPLKAHRVDFSTSGDSILTDIMDGIAHSLLVLADVSSMGKDSVTGTSYRNGNVMYEVGVALACRQPHEVLLIRDDSDKFLFDVSTVPHMHVDFTDEAAARLTLQDALIKRLDERRYINDARVQIALSSLTDHEVQLLRKFANVPVGRHLGWEMSGTVLSVHENAIARLLDKQLIRLVGTFPKGFPAYSPTELGRVVADLIPRTLDIPA